MKKVALFVTKSLMILWFLSCSKSEQRPSECPLEKDIGDLVLLDESIEFLPYSQNHSKVIFKDSLGNDLKLTIKRRASSRRNILLTKECASNSAYETEFKGTKESICYEMINSFRDYKFLICVSVEVNNDAPSKKEIVDVLTVSYRDLEQLLFPGAPFFEILIDQRNYSEYQAKTILFEEELTLNNRQFKEVYYGRVNWAFIENYDFFYNKEFGLLQFVDRKNKKTYTYDSVE